MTRIYRIIRCRSRTRGYGYSSVINLLDCSSTSNKSSIARPCVLLHTRTGLLRFSAVTFKNHARTTKQSPSCMPAPPAPRPLRPLRSWSISDRNTEPMQRPKLMFCCCERSRQLHPISDLGFIKTQTVSPLSRELQRIMPPSPYAQTVQHVRVRVDRCRRLPRGLHEQRLPRRPQPLASPHNLHTAH